MTPEALGEMGVDAADELARHRVSRAGGLGAAVFGFAFLMALFPMRCFDTWWHLANGREIVQGRGIPRDNRYSFTYPDYKVTPTHWLFGLGAWCVHAVAGVSGLVFVKAVLVALAFLAAYVLARRRGAGEVAAALVVAVGVLASRRRFLERPHLFTMLGLAACAWLVYRLREAFAEGGGARARRYAAAIPLVALVWAQLHAGCVFGVGLVALEAAGESLSYLRRRIAHGEDDEATRRHGLIAVNLGAAAACSALAVMLTPAGWTVWTYNLWHVGLDEVVALVEFQAATPATHPLFYLMLAAGAAAMLLDRRRVAPGEWLVFIVFAAVGIYAVRGVPKFVLLAAPGLAARASRGWRRLGSLPRLARPTALAARVPPMAVGIVLVFAPFLAHLAGGEGGKYRIGMGLARGFFPEGAAGFVKNEVPNRRVFHDMASGGYLAWRWFPERCVFVDGRTNAYPPDVFRDLYDGPGDAELVEFITGYYECNVALVYFYRGASAPARNRFWNGFDLDRWAVVYAEEPALVLARRTAANRGLIAGHEGALSEGGKGFLARRLRERGLEAVRGKRPREAITPYRMSLALEPERLDARLNLAYAYLDCRMRREAKEQFADALERRPGTAAALLGLAESLDALDETAEAVRRYREFLEVGGGEREMDRARRRLAEIEEGPSRREEP